MMHTIALDEGALDVVGLALDELDRNAAECPDEWEDEEARLRTIAGIEAARTQLHASSAAATALTAFADTVEATGGVVESASGQAEPVGDRTWSDLGEAYLDACTALGREPVWNDDPEAGLGGDC